MQKQLFVYDVGDGPRHDREPDDHGEPAASGCTTRAAFDPRPYVEMVRPKEVLCAGFDLDGNEIEIEADELIGRLFQHELDHLNGVLMFDRMTPEQRKEAMREYRRLQDEPPAAPARSVACA